MAETQAQAEARIRAETPAGSVSEQVGGELVALTGAAYDAWVVQQARLQIEGQVFDEARDAEAAFRRAVHTRMTRLRQIADDTRPTNQVTNAQRDQATKDVADSVWHLGRILIDRGVIEPETG